jgi:hypothetical protein
MYEDVAAAVYRHMTGQRLYDFGLIQHPTCPYFGASPDGIAENGVLVEFKCPWRRKIDGSLPPQYHVQILGQLDCTLLQECDYVEVKIVEMPSEQLFWQQFEERRESDAYKGIVAEKPGQVYEYSGDPRASEPSLRAWLLARRVSRAFSKFHFWKVERVHVKRVYQDRAAMDGVLRDLAPVWANVLRYRASREAYDADFVDKKKLDKVVIALEESEPLHPTTPIVAGFAFLEEEDEPSSTGNWYE